MDEYKVLIYPRAYRDIEEIYEYIAFVKLSADSAKKQSDRIQSALKKLKTFSYSHQDRLEGVYAGKGYKQLLIDNYLAIYKINEKEKTVYVVTIQYLRRNV